MGNVVWENPLRRMEQAVDKVSRDYTRQIRWHKKHLRTVSAKLTVPEYELFRAMCTARHTTPYAVLCKMVRAYINMSVQGGAEALMHRAMGGILDKITDMTLFLNPTEQSYSRLGAHKAPKYISWSSNNRSQLIRVPAASGEYRRFELRSPDCTANPYLAFALLIWAGLSGIENDIALPEACNVNLHTADSRNVTLATLPKSLSDAEKCAADSNFIAQHLPQSLIEFFTK